MYETTVKKNDFIEIKYTGYANGEIFDSNIEEDIKKLNKEAGPYKTIIAVGNEMLIKGFDRELEGKEIGKTYEITLSPKESFGERKRELVKIIPLNLFTEKDVSPKPGMVLTLDNHLVRIITISGARVITDFNNPLAGKEIMYKYTIIRKVNDEKEKIESLFAYFLGFVPEFELKEKIIVKGQKQMETFIKELNPKFKKILGKELSFEEIKKDNLENKIEDNPKTKED